MKSAALYDPYLDTLGGGEKHILSILKVLEDCGYEINIFWDTDLKKRIEQRFGLKFIKKINWQPNIFNKKHNLFKKLSLLKSYDVFFYVTDGSYFFSLAKKNYVFCMVPNKNLYKLSMLNKIKFLNYKFIANSEFTQKWLKRWGINSLVIYPFIDKELVDLKTKNLIKDKIILSVGRFFGHLHTKKQSEIINVFNKLRQNYPMFKDFHLILGGGLKKEDNSYFESLKSETKGNNSIILKTNISYVELVDLYKKSQFYLHFTGFGVDENKNPEEVEHLGISPLEAMASGCITFAYNAGGPKEIIDNGKTGFLFNDEDELVKNLNLTINNNNQQEKIRQNAKTFVKNNFSYEVFKKRVYEVFNL